MLAFGSIISSQSKPIYSQVSEFAKLREINSLKIEFLKSVLDLKQKEADLFWPVYSNYVQQRDLYSVRKKSCIIGLNNFASGQKKYTEKNLKKLLNFYHFYEDEINKIDKAFYSDLQKILPLKKIAFYYKAEEDFRVKMIQQLKGQNLK